MQKVYNFMQHRAHLAEATFAELQGFGAVQQGADLDLLC